MAQPDGHQSDILIVDDTPENLRVLQQILAEHGYRVRPAINGKMALNAIQKMPPDLILLDIVMPGMDGYEVCQQLKAYERTCDIPVIFISALHGTVDKLKAFQIGGVDYITKPFQIEEVLARVNTHITIRSQQKLIEAHNAELQEALAKVKLLSGLLPICANCKKIRDDEGFWEQVEVYVRDHTEAEFSHSICPDCAQELYPELYEKLDERRQDIQDVLKKLGQANLEEIAKAVGLPESNTLNRLQIMAKDRQVKCLEVDGQNIYELL
jgi:CheY-like chemotaxis protein